MFSPPLFIFKVWFIRLFHMILPLQKLLNGDPDTQFTYRLVGLMSDILNSCCVNSGDSAPDLDKRQHIIFFV